MVNTSENRKLVFDSKSQKLVMLGILLSVAGGIAAGFIYSGTIGGSEKTIVLAAGIVLAIISLVFLSLSEEERIRDTNIFKE